MLGPEWFQRDARGVRSGVELGFLSTTLDQHVALQYSGVSRGTGPALAQLSPRIHSSSENIMAKIRTVSITRSHARCDGEQGRV